MPYLGASPTVGLVTKLSNIASSFNGVTTTFQLSVPPGGVTNYFTPGSTYALFVRLGGVTQNPDVDYTVSGSQITFTTAPAAGLVCFIIAIGQAINVGTPADGSVSQSKLGTITSLSLTGATSGTTTIAPPAVAGSNIITLPASNGSAYQIFRNGATAGTTEFADKIVSGSALAYNWNGLTTNTSLDFTGIPSWVKRITVMFNGVSTSGTSALRFQIGSGSIASSGYVGSSTNVQNANATNATAYAGGGFDLYTTTATVIQYGCLRLHNINSTAWVADGLFSRTTAVNGTDFTAGSVSLSGTLDRVRITTVNGTDTFDAGTINILYE